MQLYRLDGLSQFAAAYGAGTFGGCDYNSSTACTAGTGGSNGLTNTGIAVISVVSVACMVILVAVLVRVWRRPANKAVPQEAATGDTPESGNTPDDTHHTSAD